MCRLWLFTLYTWFIVPFDIILSSSSVEDGKPFSTTDVSSSVEFCRSFQFLLGEEPTMLLGIYFCKFGFDNIPSQLCLTYDTSSLWALSYRVWGPSPAPCQIGTDFEDGWGVLGFASGQIREWCSFDAQWKHSLVTFAQLAFSQADPASILLQHFWHKLLSWSTWRISSTL